MGLTTQTFRGKAVVEAATAFSIKTVTTSATPLIEISIALSSNVKSFIISVRGQSKLRLAAVSGDTSDATKYFEIGIFNSYEQVGLNFSGTLFLATAKPSQIIQLIEWT